ncbi:hypothetical protein [Fontivita pretiosa]|uniref:hypothetical protein n=1 Tax=Fontivita pretiosa TaxID=2989684 RepID=UPI003D16947D
MQQHDHNPRLDRVGQSDGAGDMTYGGRDRAPGPNEGAIAGWVIIVLFYFIAGVLLGAWLW